MCFPCSCRRRRHDLPRAVPSVSGGGLPPLLALLPLLLLSFAVVVLARNSPPELFPLEGQQYPIRLPGGTRAFRLTCPVRTDDDDDPQQQPVIIRWTKDGQPVDMLPGEQRHRLANGDKDLRLTRLEPRDSGLYRCTAINEWGHRSMEFALEVFNGLPGQTGAGLVSPSLSDAPSLAALLPPPVPRIEQNSEDNSNGNGTVRTGRTAQLQCRVDWRGEKEKAVIRWLRLVDNADAVRREQPDAVLLRLGNMTLLVMDDQGEDAVRVDTAADGSRQLVNELRIRSARPEDSGRYFCVVSSPSGQFVNGSVLLSVLDSPWQPVLTLPSSPSARLAFLLSAVLLLLCSLLATCLCLCRPSRRKYSADLLAKSSQQVSANNTFASSASSSADSTNLRTTTVMPPPPPKMPPPLLPPSVSSFRTSGKKPFQPPAVEPSLWLHRTSAEDELSRVSTHIYASGSPLPTPFPRPPLAPSTTPQVPPHGVQWQMPPRRAAVGEQETPLIEPQRRQQPPKFWHC